MKKNKAFTLIELLAVIVILGILSILIVPKVMTSINESEEKTNMSSAENLLSTAIYKVTNNDIQGSNKSITINYTTGENTDYLEYSGKKPLTGKILIKSNGQIAMAVQIGNYCYKKESNENEITSIKYNKDTCITRIPEIVTSGDGLYESELEPGRFIYRGENPNNYINIKEDGINNTLYRIVSYEPDDTIKVVRKEKIGEYSWDEIGNRTSEDTYCTNLETSGCNVWGNSSNTQFQGELLGDNFYYSYYENSTDTILKQSTSGKITKDSTLNTFLNGKTATSWQPAIILDKYIENHKFNVGGLYYYSYYKGGDKGLKKEKMEESLYTWFGKIGLMNITEYVETSLNQECTSLYSNYYYNTKYYYKETNDSSPTIHLPEDGWPCKKMNWSMKDYNQWTMTPYSRAKYYVWDIAGTGSFSNDYGNKSSTKLGVNPTFYLKSTLQLAGQGTVEHPYYIVES